MIIYQGLKMQHQWNGNIYHNISSPQFSSGIDLIKHIKLGDIHTVIDIGCGSGKLTNEISRLIPEAKILAIDISSSMIEKAKQNLSNNIEFICEDFLHLNITEKVDLIFSNKVFHWILDQEALFYKIYKILKPSGQLIVSFGAEGSMPKFREACYQVGLDFNHLNLKLSNSIYIVNLLKNIGFKVKYHEVIWNPCEMENKIMYKEFVENILLQGANMNSEEKHSWALKISSYINDYKFNFADMTIVAIKQ